MWAAQFIKYERPNAWINSGGLGTMGYSVPAAMGAKVAEPERTVWAIDGDGCFQMTNQELATCVINDIPIKVAIINNSSLGMVRQWQTLFYNERYSNTDLQPMSQRVPDFVKLADAYGCLGLRGETPEEVDAVIKQALETNDRPVVIDFIVHRDAMVWPMVAGRRQQRQDPGRAPRGAGLGAGGLSMSKHTLSVLVEDKPGVLTRVAALFSRRGFNINSLAVGPTELPEISRITVVVEVDAAAARAGDQAAQQAHRGAQDRRARPARLRAARDPARQGPGRPGHRAARSSTRSSSSRPRSST